MSLNKTNNILVIFVIILSIVASFYGFFSNNVVYENKTFLSINDETVNIYGKGLYYNDSVSMASQGRAQDIVTLIVCVPLLIVSLIFANKKSLRGKLLLAGILGYFLYTYTSYSFLSMYNKFFLIYVIIMSLSFFSFIINITSNELKLLQRQFKQTLPRKYIGGFLIFLGTGICFMWLGRIVPSFKDNSVVAGLEHYTTLVIQALDLGFIVPVAIISGILLIKNNSLGYLLAPIIIIKGTTLLLAIMMMVIFMINAGVTVSIIEIKMFPLFTVICIYNLYLIMKNMM
jgi:hypothetical protein